MTHATTRAGNPSDSLNTKDLRRILASSAIGSIIEYYDFILYATAASLIFDKVFFSNLPSGVALFASFGTLAVGYIARPLGGVVFGHFGDRVSRKRMLVVSMLLMGFATVAIGLLPTQSVIGLAAPILLVVLRVVQGLSVGGEWGGATLMALEHAPASKRGFAAAFANAGGPAGGLVATFVVSGVSALTGPAFLDWGWRIPFLLSAVLILIGLVIRLKVAESPVFQALDAQAAEVRERKRFPVVAVFRKHWRPLVLTLVASLGFYTMQGFLTSWGVSVANAEGVSREGILNVKGIAAVVTIVGCFAAARASDRLGRRAVLAVGGVLGILWVYPALVLLHNGTLWGFSVAVIVGNGLVQGLLAGPIGAYISEQFPPEVRYTGASLSYQTASTLGAGLTPMLATLLVMVDGSFALVGVAWALILAAGLVAVFLSREGTRLGADAVPVAGTRKPPAAVR
ncbi:MFS transporter [Sinomonas sp. B1-1]|uniref:MFS transporter n=1 Tax=Sinomonas sp. B1-1 TaxID=3141454 RepID=UPI003D2AA96C